MYIFKPSVLQMLIFTNFHIKNNNQIKKNIKICINHINFIYLSLVKEKMRNKSVNFVVEIK